MPRMRPSAPMPVELEKRLSTGDSKVSLEERTENAYRVLQNLDPYVWPPESEWPAKPAAIVAFDSELVKYQQTRDRGEKITKDEAAQLKELGHWRAAVSEFEGKLVGNLLLLVGCVSIFEQQGLEDEGQRVRSFIVRQYACNLPVPAPDPWCDWTRRFCQHFAQNTALLPIHLRKMTKPPAEHRDMPEVDQGELYGA